MDAWRLCALTFCTVARNGAPDKYGMSLRCAFADTGNSAVIAQHIKKAASMEGISAIAATHTSSPLQRIPRESAAWEELR